MTFKESISTCLFKKYAVFNERASRSEYWWFRLFKYLLLACCCLISMFMQKEQPALIFSVLLILFIPNLAVTRRRSNDCCMYKNNSWLFRIGMWLAMAVIIFFAVIADILTLVPLDDPSQNAYEFFYPCLCAMSYEIPFSIMNLKTWNDSENVYGPSPFETEGNDSSYESSSKAKDSQADSEKAMKEVRIYSDYSSFVWLLGWSAGLVTLIWLLFNRELNVLLFLFIILLIIVTFMLIIDHIKCIYLKIKNQPAIIFNEIGVHISTWTGYNVYEWYEIEEFEIDLRVHSRESYLIITTIIGEEVEVKCDCLQRSEDFIYKTFKEQYAYYRQKVQ